MLIPPSTLYSPAPDSKSSWHPNIPKLTHDFSTVVRDIQVEVPEQTPESGQCYLKKHRMFLANRIHCLFGLLFCTRSPDLKVLLTS